MDFHHVSVLYRECMEGLALRPDGVYLDGTLGAAAMRRHPGAPGSPGPPLRHRPGPGGLVRRLRPVEGSPLHPHPGQFPRCRGAAGGTGRPAPGRHPAGPGVSSHQPDERSRGFSYHDDAPLDMRMDPDQALTAGEIVNTWPPEELVRILRDYGEEKWAVQIVRVLCDRRRKAPIATTAALVDVIDAAIPKKVRAKDGSHPARRSFQALRIAVNDELAPLEGALRDLANLLAPKGRLCVIAFHSLEDRIVKNTFRSLADCTCPKHMPVCVCGKKPLVRLVTRKPITAGAEELAANPRARSALLRIAERREDGRGQP